LAAADTAGVLIAYLDVIETSFEPLVLNGSCFTSAIANSTDIGFYTLLPLPQNDLKLRSEIWAICEREKLRGLDLRGNGLS